MTNLKPLYEIQCEIQNAIQTGASSNSVLTLVRSGPPISEKERLLIYQEAYKARLGNSIHEDFLRTQEKAGKSEFSQVVETFLNLVPSRTPNLAEYSEGFLQFIRNHHPELELEACKDWLEILYEQFVVEDTQTQPPQIPANDVLRVEVGKNTQSMKLAMGSLIAYKLTGEIEFLQINENERRLFEFLIYKKSLSEIENFILSEKISWQETTEFIEKSFQRGILKLVNEGF